jgi:hypothetical protein
MPGLTFFEALAVIVICAATSGFALAQDMPSSAAQEPPAAPAPNPATEPAQAAAQPAPAQPAPAPDQPAAQKLSNAQLDQLLRQSRSTQTHC